MEQNPEILSALLPYHQHADVSSSTQDMNEVMLTGQAVVNQSSASGDGQRVVTTCHQETVDVINDQGVHVIHKGTYDQVTVVDIDDQKSFEPVTTQEVTESINTQDGKLIDQDVTDLISSASQGIDDAINDQDSNMVADQQTAIQIVDNQGDMNVTVNQELAVDSQRVDQTVTGQAVIDQEVTELVSNEGVDESVNIQRISADIDNQQPQALVNDSQTHEINQSGILDNQVDQPAVLLPTMGIPQDSASHDLVNTPQRSKSLLEQTDIWQSSFVLTQPSCIKCPGELRSLWREPVMDNKASTQPLQHYVLSSNSDQVSCDVV